MNLSRRFLREGIFYNVYAILFQEHLLSYPQAWISGCALTSQNTSSPLEILKFVCKKIGLFKHTHTHIISIILLYIMSPIPPWQNLLSWWLEISNFVAILGFHSRFLPLLKQSVLLIVLFLNYTATFTHSDTLHEHCSKLTRNTLDRILFVARKSYQESYQHFLSKTAG